MTARAAVLLLVALSAACGAGPVRPIAVDRQNDQCASCRMILSETRVASQVAAPGEEPRFFDDLQCLRDGLRNGQPLPRGAVIYLVDFRTGAWVRADSAVIARLPDVDTPMASHWVAYADEPSRRLDPTAAGVSAIPVAAFIAAGGEESRR